MSIKISNYQSRGNGGGNIMIGGKDVGSCPECKSTNVVMENIEIIGGIVKCGHLECDSCGFEGKIE